jgi:hypothetical protein
MTIFAAAGGMGLGLCGEARHMPADAGFTSIDVKHAEGGVLNTCYIVAET